MAHISDYQLRTQVASIVDGQVTFIDKPSIVFTLSGGHLVRRDVSGGHATLVVNAVGNVEKQKKSPMKDVMRFLRFYERDVKDYYSEVMGVEVDTPHGRKKRVEDQVHGGFTDEYSIKLTGVHPNISTTCRQELFLRLFIKGATIARGKVALKLEVVAHRTGRETPYCRACQQAYYDDHPEAPTVPEDHYCCCGKSYCHECNYCCCGEDSCPDCSDKANPDDSDSDESVAAPIHWLD